MPRSTPRQSRPPRQPPAASGAGRHSDFLKHNLREYGMLLSLVAIMVLLPGA